MNSFTDIGTTKTEKEVQIEVSWKAALSAEFSKPYFKSLIHFVKSEYLSKDIFPKPKDIFSAFNTCPFNHVKVVIIGQDPYHGKDQAIGLSFAVSKTIPLPPSLKNIFKEIIDDTGIVPRLDGDLSRWATQGVLLLNATLTVESGRPGSHQGKGWEEFTDAVIKALSDKRDNLVFILWGNYAKAKGAHIDRSRHLVLESAHPSPFSAYNGFFGCKHFSKTNQFLKSKNLPTIDWA